MIPEDPIDFDYAIENTHVLISPQQAIATFGETHFEFQLLTELMDEAGTYRLRRGSLHAERPRIIAPNRVSNVFLEGFEEHAEAFAEIFAQQTRHLKILQYGFNLKKKKLSEEILRGSRETIIAKLEQEIQASNNPMQALIEGVDDAWEACLLKFTIDLIRRSVGGNYNEWKKRGLISE
jgi:uncharacterized protein with von Willebrand factor type A (vWA) domain